MLTYSNRLKKLILPEYGRNIQNMVDHCMSIEDRLERTECAYAIIDAMTVLFPPTGDNEEYMRKLWDHLIIMSDFTLDVDFPFEHLDPPVFEDKPDPVPVSRPGYLHMRHYGDLIPRLIDTACSLEPGDERDALVTLIANQMKKALMETCPEGVDDMRVLKDLQRMSHGQISADPEAIRLHDFNKQAPTPSGKKKKRK
ncbi:MAG: DUF4290 domain-containing protein [Muribaculaceae bacterium]|nr:DUF4290 domain-containing protein [Muribaculaceae bacterium]MDE6575358.1 DUF4290 domain-containing protein [Muribaculaceae bacterium]